MREIYIYGAKSYGQTLANLARALNFKVVSHFDDFHSGHGLAGGFEDLKRLSEIKSASIALGVGYKNMTARSQLISRLRSINVEFPPLAHTTAGIDKTVTLGDGAVIMRGAICDFNSTVGAFSVIWPGALINHDSRVGENTFISPGAVVCGNVTIGANCFVGAGAIIADGRDVPDGSFVKAGSLVK